MTEYELTDSEFKKFSDLVYSKTGINLHYGKKQLLQSRANKVLRKRGIHSYKDYYQIIIDDSTNQELHEFINLISTNVTHFFREEKHFQFMKNVWAPDVIKERKSAVEIWSSACSSGEEPYSIAIMLSELFEKNPLRMSVLASDISTKVLSIAQRGIYTSDRVENIDQKLIKKYFQEGNGSAKGYVKVKNEIRQMVQFKRINLIEAFPDVKQFDIIFCRNVMIYFDLPTKQMIVNKLAEHIKPGGYLFIGHSESLNGLKSTLKYVMPATYRKEGF